MESSTLVIKVQHGDMLRRFNANDKLKLTMDKLKDKILSLFKFPRDSDLILTYVDEDGDFVTLVDDHELRDAVEQSLNPLRITVKINDEKNSRKYYPTSGNSKQEIIPDSVHETLLKLSNDLSSKAGITDLVEYFSKVGLAYMDQFPKDSINSIGKKENIAKENVKKKSECSTVKNKFSAPTFVEDENNLPTEKELNKRTVPSSGFRHSPNSIWANKRGGFKFYPNPTNECPFSGEIFPNVLSKKERLNTFHLGVQCDGCGVHPIAGPRFKSKVKLDYDLCMICFAELGNESDYIRMEQPVAYQHMACHHVKNHVSKCSKVNSVALKLHSQFIQDVNISDGTIVAPSTPFTKIWRMRNNGTLAWPQKTQLVWIGGDRLNTALAVDLKIPAPGLAIGHDFDVSVDLISPKTPGRYISYWRMASPEGKTFGQRVWVLIKVNAPVNLSPLPGDIHAFNLNLPPVNNSLPNPEIINVEPEQIVEGNSNPTLELKEPVLPNDAQNIKSPINDSPKSSEDSSILSPIIDISDVVPVTSSVPLPVAEKEDEEGEEEDEEDEEDEDEEEEEEDEEEEDEEDEDEDEDEDEEEEEEEEEEEKLVNELEKMGFKQVDLNKEILRKNDHDLKKAVDDLCGISEWDPILEELQEMGFYDKDMNKKLLEKNQGSVKRVVMDLIAAEKKMQ